MPRENGLDDEAKWHVNLGSKISPPTHSWQLDLGQRRLLYLLLSVQTSLTRPFVSGVFSMLYTGNIFVKYAGERIPTLEELIPKLDNPAISVFSGLLLTIPVYLNH